ncbi:MAG: 4Fe-4S binding protein [Clostridiales bacterium]|nr:4Fe-4S binding protein [Clostridiales bacterium]
MNADDMTARVLEFQEVDASNRISEEVAKKPEYTGRKIYEGAVCGVAAADDGLISSLNDNKEANLRMMQPKEWLAGAKSIVSFFMPFARWIAEENVGGDWPSDGWLHGRIDGQPPSDGAIKAVAEAIRAEGYEAVIPMHDTRLEVFMNPADPPGTRYTSNWSERHAAFAAGLGTFGVSRGLITELGTAGRFASLVTTLPLAPTPRPYTGLLEYCTRCGACVAACPSGAIPADGLKDHLPCSLHLIKIKEKEDPYFGCGKCQSGMPCSFSRP